MHSEFLPCWGHVGPDVVPVLGLCSRFQRPDLVVVLEPCWTYVGPMLGLFWSMLGSLDLRASRSLCLVLGPWWRVREQHGKAPRF